MAFLFSRHAKTLLMLLLLIDAVTNADRSGGIVVTNSVPEGVDSSSSDFPLESLSVSVRWPLLACACHAGVRSWVRASQGDQIEWRQREEAPGSAKIAE
jgi:hypothetical protein